MPAVSSAWASAFAADLANQSANGASSPISDEARRNTMSFFTVAVTLSNDALASEAAAPSPIQVACVAPRSRGQLATEPPVGGVKAFCRSKPYRSRRSMIGPARTSGTRKPPAKLTPSDCALVTGLPLRALAACSRGSSNRAARNQLSAALRSAEVLKTGTLIIEFGLFPCENASADQLLGAAHNLVSAG